MCTPVTAFHTILVPAAVWTVEGAQWNPDDPLTALIGDAAPADPALNTAVIITSTVAMIVNRRRMISSLSFVSCRYGVLVTGQSRTMFVPVSTTLPFAISASTWSSLLITVGLTPCFHRTFVSSHSGE